MKITHRSIHIHTHKKRKRGKNIHIVAPKVHPLNLGWFVVYSGISQMQGTLSWLWRFNVLLLRMLGEISLSLFGSQSSWGPALDLDPPLRVGHRSLRSSWIGGSGSLRLGEGGVWMRDKPVVAEPRRDVATAWGAPCILPGHLSLDHGNLAVAGCTGSQDGRFGEWPVLAHWLLGGGSSSLNIPCLSCGPHW